jgi:hypothetical protein
MSITREQLYEDVWSTPATSLMAKYKVSATYLVRICARLNVPRPPRGYWAKLKFGKAAPRPPLPAARPGDELDWMPGRDARFYPERRTPPALPAARSDEPAVRARVRRSTQHQLLVGARENFLNGREPGRYSTDVPYLRPYKQKLVDLVVTKEVLNTAIREANLLFQTLEARGHRVILAPFNSAFRYGRASIDYTETPARDYYFKRPWSPATPTLTFVGSVAFGLTLYELSEEAEVRSVDGKYVRVADLSPDERSKRRPAWDTSYTRSVASGRLAVCAYSPYPRVNWTKVWRSTRRGDRAATAKEIAEAIEQAAPSVADLFAQAERERLEEQARYEAKLREAARIAEENRRLHAMEESRSQLLAAVDAWAQARSIETFFEDATRRAGELPVEDRTALLERIDDARRLLGGIDALEYFRAWMTPLERLERPQA